MTQSLKPLTKNQIKFLRGEAHSLKPVVMVGANGITETLLVELNNALNHHELVKIKIRAEEREEKAKFIARLCKHSKAHKIDTIGHNLVLFRQSENKKIQLPKK